MIAPLVLSFDLDDTLWPVEPVMVAAENTMWSWLRERHPELMKSQSIETMRAVRAKINQRYPERIHDMTFMRRRTLQEMFGDHSEAEALADQAFEVFYAARNRVTFYDDVEPALRRLKRRYRLFALSNGNADLQRTGLAELFEGHVTAISAGAAKPDARIFAKLRELAGVDAAQILHVGDDPHADVVGATQAGMQSIWMNREAREWPPQFAPPARTISTLEEIV
jgi:FMN hydrolase / 5-amino-6-(5-phospho-D-ribitylamino)uracil phosphatase